MKGLDDYITGVYGTERNATDVVCETCGDTEHLIKCGMCGEMFCEHHLQNHEPCAVQEVDDVQL